MKFVDVMMIASEVKVIGTDCEKNLWSDDES